MLRITFLCQGRLKETYYKEACNEYLKRLGAFCRAEVQEIAEREDAAAHLPRGAYLIALCVEGKKLSSEELAEKLRILAIEGVSRICFLLGGSEGLSDAAKQAADFCLSMSDMTFPHHLARVMILEQVYRSFTIISGTKYHK